MEDVIKGMPKSLIGSLSGLKGVYGIATDGEITTLTDSLKNFDVNMFANSLVAIDIDGVEYIRTVISNTNNRFTFAPLAVKVQASVVIGEDLGGQVTATIVEPGVAGNDYSIIFTEDAYSAFTVATIEGNVITVVLETDAGTKSTANVITTGGGEIDILAPIAGVAGDAYSAVLNENTVPADDTTATFANDILTIGLKIDDGMPSRVVFGDSGGGYGRVDISSTDSYEIANAYTLAITQSIENSAPTVASFDAGVLTVVLGTTEAGAPNATAANVVDAVALLENFNAVVVENGWMETTAGVSFGEGRGSEVMATATDVKTAVELTTDFTVNIIVPGLVIGKELPVVFTGGVDPVSNATATDVANAINGIEGISAAMTGAGGIMEPITLTSFEGGYDGISVSVGDSYSLILK